MSGHCKDCHWWTPPGAVTYHGDAGYGSAQGCCELTRLNGDPVHPLSLAVAEDVDYYKAVLLTAPDFGCVQFAAKEDCDGC